MLNHINHNHMISFCHISNQNKMFNIITFIHFNVIHTQTNKQQLNFIRKETIRTTTEEKEVKEEK